MIHSLKPILIVQIHFYPGICIVIVCTAIYYIAQNCIIIIEILHEAGFQPPGRSPVICGTKTKEYFFCIGQTDTHFIQFASFFYAFIVRKLS